MGSWRALCFYVFCACIFTSVRRVFEVSLSSVSSIGVCFFKGCGERVREDVSQKKIGNAYWFAAEF